ncbi:MAG: glycosyltransferase family 9 protein [Alphaproteobacteria bacterium]|nr:glycosyltransferase family 9 protein [Alphaproteobacteria bacterium]
MEAAGPDAGAAGGILVIKLAALGDVVQAFGPFAAIRAHHAGDRIRLLTTAPYAALLARAPWFDRIAVDARPKLWQLGALWRLRRGLRAPGYARVYDLQTSDRSGWYFRLMRGSGPGGRDPEWSGIAAGCSHPHANPSRDAMHTIDRQREQLAMAGITAFPAPDLGWLAGDPGALAPAGPFALLVPGGAAHRPTKRWPAERFAVLAEALAGRGITPLVLGTAAERPLAEAIRARCPAALDRTGATGLADIAALGARAALAVGNDTGPMHLIAAMGAPCLVLFSAASDPALCAPRRTDGGAEGVAILRRDSLGALDPEAVLAALPQPRS